mgnify:FL=1
MCSGGIARNIEGELALVRHDGGDLLCCPRLVGLAVIVQIHHHGLKQQVISGGQAHREVLQRIGGIALQIGHDHVGLGLIHAEADLLFLGVQRVFRYVARSILGVEGQAIDAVIGKVLGQHGVDVLIPLTIAAPHLDAVVRTLLQMMV